MKHQFIRAACTVLALTHLPMYAPLSFVELKGTHVLFGEDRSHLLPTHGCAWWHTTMLPDLYNRGDRRDATVQLITKLFHTVEDDLRPTKHPNKVATYFCPETIGAILSTLEKPTVNRREELCDAIKHNLLYKKPHPVSADQITQHITDQITALETELQQTIEIGRCLDGDWQTCRNIIGYNKRELQKFAIFGLLKQVKKKRQWQQKQQVWALLTDPEKTPTTVLKRISAERRKLKKRNASIPADLNTLRNEKKEWQQTQHDIRRMVRRIPDLATLITASHSECSLSQPTQKYPPFTLHNILLSLLWAKAQDIEDLHRYARATKYTRFAPLADRYAIADHAAISRTLIHTMQSQQDKTLHISNEQFEQLIFAVMVDRLRIIPLAEDILTTCHGITFSDCVETALRNLFNILLYDTTTRRFDINKLTDIFGSSVDKQLVTFYQNELSNPEFIMTPEAHNAWAEVLSNRPGIAYKQAAQGVEVLSRVPENFYRLITILTSTQNIDMLLTSLGLAAPTISAEGKKIRFSTNQDDYLIKIKHDHTGLARIKQSSHSDSSYLAHVVTQSLNSYAESPAQNNIRKSIMRLLTHHTMTDHHS